MTTPPAREVNAYRHRVHGLLGALLEPHLPLARALDFGSGDGWFAHRLKEDRWVEEVTAVDVQHRRQQFVAARLYDGGPLPFADASFDLVYAIDVLHHCEDPRASLEELTRCSSRFLVLKDHTYRGVLGRLTLAALDEIGNRRFGVPSSYRYQRRWEWLPQIESAGFELLSLVHPAPCHTGPLGRATNGLQFVGLWRRPPG